MTHHDHATLRDARDVHVGTLRHEPIVVHKDALHTAINRQAIFPLTSAHVSKEMTFE